MPWTRNFAPSPSPARLGRLLLEDADELGADRLALRLRVGDAGELGQEAILGVDGDERDLEVVAERGDDLLALVLAHEAVVDEDARELVADRAVDEQRGDARVHAAGEPADHAPVADLLADALDLLLDDARGAPRHVGAADVAEEALEDVLPVRRVDDLGVELDAVDAALDRLERRDRRLRRRGERREARRRRVDGVAVRHPARLLGRQAGEQPPGLAHHQLRAAELPHLRALDAPAERERHELHAVTDAQHGDPELEQLGVELRRAVGVHRRRAAGEDQPLRLAAPDLLGPDVVRQQLAEDAALADAPRDELRVLPAVVEDDDLVDRARRGDVDRATRERPRAPRLKR